jgi:CRISPR-associated endonuclease/helicase Cas3
VERITLAEPPEGAEGQGETRYLVLGAPPRGASPENPEAARTRQTLGDHTSRIVEHIRRIADALGLEGSLKDALMLGAECHDLGKDRPVWQRYACNLDSDRPLAKSPKYLSGRALGGYRHEFGSLLDIADDPRIKDHPELEDLILHLIAAHHGWGRPHFEPRSYDRPPATTAVNEESAIETMRRFGQLQQRFGRWGLAWLESLLRCADALASRDLANDSQEMQP